MSDTITDADLDKFLADMDASGAILTCKDMDQIEQAWEKRRRARRCALVLLTKPFEWLQEQVREDRGFALAVANVHLCTEDSKLEFYKGVHKLLKEAFWRATAALCERDDMAELLAEAERGEGEPGEVAEPDAEATDKKPEASTTEARP